MKPQNNYKVEINKQQITYKERQKYIINQIKKLE